MTSLSDLNSMPVSAGIPGSGNEQLLANVPSFSRVNSQAIYSHYNVMPVIDVFGVVGGRDLGRLLKDTKPSLGAAQQPQPAGSSILLRRPRGQIQPSLMRRRLG